MTASCLEIFIFLGPKSDRCLLLSVTDCCLVDLTDVILAFEDVVSVADVDADDSLVENLKYRFEQYLVTILKLFGQDLRFEI